MSLYTFSETIRNNYHFEYPMLLTIEADCEDSAADILTELNRSFAERRLGWEITKQSVLESTQDRYSKNLLGNYIVNDVKSENAGAKLWYRVGFDVKHNGKSSYIVDVNAGNAAAAKTTALTLFESAAPKHSHLFHVTAYKIEKPFFTSYTWYKLEENGEKREVSE